MLQEQCYNLSKITQKIILSRVDERFGFMTPQQPINQNKVLIPTKQTLALGDDFYENKKKNPLL